MREKGIDLSLFRVLIRGGGDLASGVGWRLHNCGFRILITETHQPLAVRRKVSFCEAVYEASVMVEGVRAVLIKHPDEALALWEKRIIPVIVDPEAHARNVIHPHVLVDGIMAKRNTGTFIDHAPLVIGLGPGFIAGDDVHFVVETKRGHNLGKLISSGSAAPDTGEPGPVMGISSDRVLRAPDSGVFRAQKEIGDLVSKGELVGQVEDHPVKTSISGVIRGLIHEGIRVTKGLKIGDVDPRGIKEYCYTISDKALAIAGGVLEGILRGYGATMKR